MAALLLSILILFGGVAGEPDADAFALDWSVADRYTSFEDDDECNAEATDACGAGFGSYDYLYGHFLVCPDLPNTNCSEIRKCVGREWGPPGDQPPQTVPLGNATCTSWKSWCSCSPQAS